MRRPRRRSKRSAELMRVAALDTDSSFWPDGDSAEPSGPWKPCAERATEICRSGRADRPARRGHGRAPLRRLGRRGGQREAGEHEQDGGEGGGSDHRRLINPGRDIRRGGADGTGAAAIVAADGHRLAFDGGAGHDATGQRARLLPAVATVVGVAVLLRLVYEPWFLNYDARYALVWARDIATGLTPDYTGPYAPDPAPARDRSSSLVAVPFGEGGDSIMVWARPALLRRARVARLPARRGAVLARGRRRGGARGADAAGARARRAARLPGHPVRRPDRVGGAARGAPAAPRRARARPARGGRADAPGGVGARRALRALRVARRLDARARRLRRADRARAGAVGARWTGS